MITDRLLHRIRAHLASPGVTPTSLARAAGLHPNTLRGAERDDWNPTSATLRAVEPLLPPDDMADRPAASPTNPEENIRHAGDPPHRDGEAGHGHPFSATCSPTSGSSGLSGESPAPVRRYSPGRKPMPRGEARAAS